jgi:hypothetical protein
VAINNCVILSRMYIYIDRVRGTFENILKRAHGLY